MNIEQKTLRKIAELLPPGQLISSCKMIPKFQNACNNDEFWKNKIKEDYNIKDLKIIPYNMTYQNFYIAMYEKTLIPVQLFINGKYIKTMYYNLKTPNAIDYVSAELKNMNIPINIKNGVVVTFNKNNQIIRSQDYFTNNKQYNFNGYVSDKPLKLLILTDQRKLDILDQLIELYKNQDPDFLEQYPQYIERKTRFLFI